MHTVKDYSKSGQTAPCDIHSFDTLPDSAFIRESQLVQSPKRPMTPAPLPFSAPTLWRKVKAGTFPKPVKLSDRVTAWRVGDVRAWIASHCAAQQVGGLRP
ncbi:MAG TPA: AlpA family phage regulatory protein [Giesbergeria sp.]|nr:AlpA family phage regulatory protein [Giesbergeria sp.]